MGVLAKGSLIRKQIILMVGDFMVGMSILLLLKTLRPIPNEISPEIWIVLFVPVLILSSYFCEIYNTRTWALKTFATRSAIATVISFFVLIVLSRLSGLSWHLISALIAFFMFQILWQALYQKTFDISFFTKNIVVIGTGATALEIDRMLKASPGKYSLSGYISTATDPVDVEKNKILGNIDNIIELCKLFKVHTIVIALTERRGNLTINKLVSCKLMGVRIIDYPNFYETMTGKIPVESINPSWLVQSSGFLITPFIRFMKRVLDILLSSLLLLLTLPFFPVIVFLVKYKSSGPLFYFQKRVGKNGKDFTIYKFRSMKTDAETNTGAAWAQEDDPRISNFGHLLRKSRIDELPQLVNVLKGNMSFIGPRPERPEFVKQISQATPYYMERHAVKPGITGWAQVMYPYGSSLGDSIEKLRYDLYYINNLSLFLELLIVLETIKVILFRKGGR
ncbi:MAG: TIGR03013 family PEP-CTERM/XrtA system glycosyltransferase [Desulfobacula sp.]|nr:TIGR03013 family PEP-CTERM/XrtA system glycosyltransferase [Desulfobacula sp.]